MTLLQVPGYFSALHRAAEFCAGRVDPSEQDPSARAALRPWRTGSWPWACRVGVAA